jgi:AP-1 complex subunit beta-1
LLTSGSGENFELRAELNSEHGDRRADAIKRVIANMTVGKDVSGLFPDVLKNMVRARVALHSAS